MAVVSLIPGTYFSFQRVPVSLANLSLTTQARDCSVVGAPVETCALARPSVSSIPRIDMLYAAPNCPNVGARKHKKQCSYKIINTLTDSSQL